MGRQMLLENPSSYLDFEESTYSEGQFIAEIVRRTGCGLLLDVNNVFISAVNLKFPAIAYIDAYPLSHVQEIYIAGHDVTRDDAGHPLLIDSHGASVVDEVWDLYAAVIARTGALPTLVERDNNVPSLDVLVAEARQADRLMRRMAKAS